MKMMAVRPRDRIFHQKFGHGVVVRTDGDKVVADFVGWGLKRVLVVFILEAQSPSEDDPVASNVVSLFPQH
jgi:hypothetical protein